MKKEGVIIGMGIALLFSCATQVSQVPPTLPKVNHQVHTLNKKYNRVTSPFLVRRVTVPTRANLDLAAYADNVTLYDPAAVKQKPKRIKKKLQDITFGGALDAATICHFFTQTPLTPAELAMPLYWPALKQHLMNWDFEKGQPLLELGMAVEDEKWGNEDIYRSLQEPARMYLHKNTAGALELWTEIEFKPWATMFKKVVLDEDGDGFTEFYGRVATRYITPALMQHIATEYAGTILDAEAVETWANELTSFWYPTYNTDIAHDEVQTQWPNSATDKDIVALLDGFTVKNPFIVIKGKPFNKPIYTVITIDGMVKAAEVDAPTEASSTVQGVLDTSVAGHIDALKKVLDAELKSSGAPDYAAWAKQYAPFYSSLDKARTALPKEVGGIPGTDTYVFFNRSYEYLTGGDIVAQPVGKNPLPVIKAFRDMLAAKGIDFLFIPIPVKSAIYPAYTGATLPAHAGVVDPYSRKFMKDLLDAGVETVDLWPLFIAHRESTNNTPLYQKQDTHWTAYGLELAAEVIGTRIKEYGWYSTLSHEKMTEHAATCTRMGDIVSRLDKPLQGNYRPAELTAHQVFRADSSLYKDKKGMPLLVLGDSFTAVFQRTECKHAGLTAHIAKEIGTPVRLIMGFGGGPSVIKKLEAKGPKELAGKRLVIWTMVSRDLYNYWENWEMIKGME